MEKCLNLWKFYTLELKLHVFCGKNYDHYDIYGDF